MKYGCHTTIICVFFYLTVYPADLSLYAREDQSTEKIFCTSCNMENPTENKFCYQCGMPLPKPGLMRNSKESEQDSIRQELLKKPAGGEDILTDPVMEHKIKEIYDYGNFLFQNKKYEEAMDQFYSIVIEYPDSPYYERARAMTEACGRILLVQKEAIQEVKKHKKSSFNSCVLGGCLAILGLIIAGLVMGAALN